MMEHYDYESLSRLARELGRPVRELLALSHKHDPFYAGMPSRKRWAEWFAAHYHAWREVHPGLHPHLRRIHYWLVDPHLGVLLLPNERGPKRGQVLPYVNDKACWTRLGTASRDARLLGLVPRRGLEDHRTPEPRLYVAKRIAAPQLVVTEPDGGEDGLEWPAYALDYGLEAWETPQPQQPIYIEVWIEDSGQDDILVPLCQRYGVNLQTGLGQMTLEAVEECWARVTGDGRPAVILYFSDYDLQGERMPSAVGRKLEWMRHEDRGRHADHAPRVRLYPVALSYEQVREHKLPLMISDDADKALRNWQEHRGGRVELEALQARAPGVFERLARGAIERLIDPTLSRRTRQAQRATDEVLAERQQAVLGRHPEVAALEERFAALRREQNALAARIAEELLVEEVALPELPEAAEHAGLEEEPLYDSERDYEEQNEVYQAWKSRNVLASHSEEEE